MNLGDGVDFFFCVVVLGVEFWIFVVWLVVVVLVVEYVEIVDRVVVFVVIEVDRDVMGDV